MSDRLIFPNSVYIFPLEAHPPLKPQVEFDGPVLESGTWSTPMPHIDIHGHLAGIAIRGPCQSDSFEILIIDLFAKQLVAVRRP